MSDSRLKRMDAFSAGQLKGSNQYTQEEQPGDLHFNEDEPFKRFFSRTQPLSIIIKGVVPEFKDYEPAEIEKYIDVEFIGKDPRVEYDSTARMLNSSSGTDSEATAEFDIYFKVALPDGTSESIALFIDLEMQQDFNPGYRIEKRCMYYPARMLSKQLGSLSDKKAYNSLQKVHSIWVFIHGYRKSLANGVLTYSISRTRTPAWMKSEEVKDIDTRMDLMDVSLVFIGDEVREGADEVVEFLNACFYDKEKLIQNERWVNPVNLKLREEADKMGSFKELYEMRGEKRGEIRKNIALVRRALSRGFSDYDIMDLYAVSEEDLADIKRLLEEYPDKPDEEIAIMLLSKKELV